MINKSVIIKTENFSFAANLEWYNTTPKKKNKDILARAKNSSLDYFVEVEIDSDKISFGLSDKSVVGEMAGAYVLQNQKQFKNVIFFSMLTEQSLDSIFDKEEYKKEDTEYYWVVVFDSNGAVLPGYDLILTKEELSEQILSNSEFSDYGYVSTRGSVSEQDAEDSNVEIISLANIFSSTEEYIKRSLKIEKISITSTNKKMIPLILMGVAVIGVGGYSSFGPMPKLDDLKAGVYSKSASKIYRDASKEIREVKTGSDNSNTGSSRNRRKTITPEEAILQGKKIVSNNFNSNYYTNQDLFDNVSILKYHFSDKILGWSKSKLNYENNKFIISYIVDSLSFDDFKALDAALQKESKKIGLLLQPLELNDEGKERVYEVKFDSKIKENVLADRQKNNELISEINVKRESLSSFERKLKGKMSSIQSSIGSVDNVNWFKLRFGNTIDGIISQIDRETQEMKKIDVKIKEIIKEIVELDEKLQTVAIKEEWISGKIDDFIVTTQDEKMFTWSYPSEYEFIPPKKGRVAVNPYVKKYSFELTPKNALILYRKLQLEGIGGKADFDSISSDDVDVGYDFRLLGVALSILNKSYIIINKVELDYKNNNFKIEGELYEKV